MKRNTKIKRTIKAKKLIAEFGDNFTEHMKKKLLEIEARSVLIRGEYLNRLDIRHVEHTLFNCIADPNSCKEYTFGQLIAEDGNLYYGEKCIENDEVMQSPIVKIIYDGLSSENMLLSEDCKAKKLDDSNIDFVIDKILTVCPPVSQTHLDMFQEAISSVRK